MAEEIVAYSLAHHPAPFRERVSLASIFYGLFAAPVFWSGQLMVDFAIVSHACYPGTAPVYPAEPGFFWAWPFVLAVDLAALALIASGGLVSYRMWRVTGPPEGHQHHLMERGEGRTRFFGIVGMSFSVLFLIVSVTMTVTLGFLPLCSQ